MILLLPATLLVLVSNVLFGGKFAEHVTCNTFSETISVIIFFAVNMAFWILMMRYFQKQHAK